LYNNAKYFFAASPLAPDVEFAANHLAPLTVVVLGIMPRPFGVAVSTLEQHTRGAPSEEGTVAEAMVVAVRCNIVSF